MSSQARLFDTDREELARERGMARSAERHASILEQAREAALHVAQNRARAGQPAHCTIEDVRQRLDDQGVEFTAGNWMGSVFRGRRWVFTGQWAKASHEGSHSRMVRVWRLR